MYRCGLCRKNQPPRTPAFKVVLAERRREYRSKGNRVSFGTEIAIETIACEPCTLPFAA